MRDQRAPREQTPTPGGQLAADAVGGADEAASRLDEDERAFLVALAGGQNATEVALAMRMSEEMIGIHMARVLAKLHRRCAAQFAHEHSGTSAPGTPAKD